MMKTRRTGNSGFTLIEVIASLVILSVGILASASVQTTMVRGSADNRFVQEASTCARSEIERIRSQLAGGLSVAGGTVTCDGYAGTVIVQPCTLTGTAMNMCRYHSKSCSSPSTRHNDW
ncbi:MAG: prepilin-type N-terminal cleavage/methylation domain-containing protein [Synechococcaceae cyanobacterium SM2_3_60]|nr:prepilin-type N-terminal cleavage/methylation domain-containing protein [Synechococcaceae cyanobacterium SM2_3_60]